MHVCKEFSVDGVLATGAKLAKQMLIATNFIQKDIKLRSPPYN